jgi:hypothetical protein
MQRFLACCGILGALARLAIDGGYPLPYAPLPFLDSIVSPPPILDAIALGMG